MKTVRAEVRARAVRVLGDNVLGNDEEWAVLAHSMGAAVAHDALHIFWNEAHAPDTPSTGSTQTPQASLVAMLANTSRLLETEGDGAIDVDRSWVRPGGVGERGRICLAYIDANHELDPTTKPAPFASGDWAATQPDGFQSVSLDHVHELNVHAFAHYVRNPAVHVPLFRALTRPSMITADMELAARDRFERFDPSGLSARLGDIERLSTDRRSNILQIVDAVRDLRNLV